MNKLLIILIGLVIMTNTVEAGTLEKLQKTQVCVNTMMDVADVDIRVRVTNKTLPGTQGVAGLKVEGGYYYYVDTVQWEENGQPYKGTKGVSTMEMVKVMNSIIANHTQNAWFNTVEAQHHMAPYCYGAK